MVESCQDLIRILPGFSTRVAMENIRTELHNILFQDIKITFAMTSVAFILKKKIYKSIVFI